MNPVLVNSWRGSAIENRYRGAVAIVESSARVVSGLGDIQRPVFPRSAIKFLQAVPFVESGALEHYELDERHIALACASHNGEPAHVDVVEPWLARLGLDENDLECGASLPMHQGVAFELAEQGRGPERTFHNCSGKHLGLLSTTLHLGENTRNYRLYNHVAERRWFDVLESMSNTRVTQLPWGYDGCGIPALALPLQRIALAMARFADPERSGRERRDVIARIHRALGEHPYLVAGKERLCTALMERLAPRVLVKVGAAGVYTACLPERGIGIALKIDDGNDRAARVALGAALQLVGELDDEDARALSEYIAPSQTNSRGDVIGRLEPSSDWVV